MLAPPLTTSVELGKSADDTLIEVQVDGQGRMVDYDVSQGQMTSEIGNLLLFTTFTPATQFLRPTTGKVVIRLSRIHGRRPR